MPAWWGRRRQSTNNNSSNKSSPKPNNDHNNNNINDSSNPVSVGRAGSGSSLRSPGPGQRSSSGFSGFDSDGYGAGSGSASTPHGGSRECHPLPLPSASPNLFDHHGGSGGGGVGFANGGSASSSGSSSISSSDDAPPPLLDHQFAQLAVSRAYDGVKLKVRTMSPGPGSRVPTTSNSPRHPQSVGGSSPLHPQFGGGSSPRHPQLVTSSSLESPGGKLEDGRSQCHPLPLPPSSPTSPSAVHSARASFAAENANNSAPSGWKKGKLLGRGTFGHVYVGFNSEMGRLCAIKEVRLISDDQNAKESLKQLNQEIILLSKLSHPNIVRYHGSELNNETLSVFLEYVSGGSIHKLLQEYGAFKEPVIQNYTRQVLYGLAYLHARNTVHRDIKGANILVDPNGEIKLADFGMAKHITNCTSVLSFKGSPYWMAPEVVMNTNGYNLAVDIWSLGCTVLEMATSKPPWSQFEGVAAIFKIGNSKDIPEIPNHLSNAAKSFLRSCLQRDPSARPSAAELLDHPFVNDQTTARISSPCTTSELFTLTSNGSSRPRDQYARPSAAEFLDHPFLADQTTARISGPCTTSELFTLTSNGNNRPQALDIHPRRKSISSYEADSMRRPVVPVSRELWDNTRTIISLPVSPCSSPLRNTSPAYKSCFLSPPHPSYAWAGGHSSHSPNDFPVSPTIAPPNYLSDPWQDTTSYKAQTPGGSPRSRPF